MRKILFIFTICLVYSFSNICLAHWLPKSELFVGGVGPGCTLEYVASVYGQPKEKRWFNSDGVRGVTYIYSPYFSITGRTSSRDPRPESELIVVGYTLKNNSLSTQSGLTVGIPYETVAGMYGTVKKEYDSYSNKFYYSYDWDDEKRHYFQPVMCFFVDKNNIITEIYVGTDW